MNILNNSGPTIECWGNPRQISDHLLYEEPTCPLKKNYGTLKIQSSKKITV